MAGRSDAEGCSFKLGLYAERAIVARPISAYTGLSYHRHSFPISRHWSGRFAPPKPTFRLNIADDTL